MIKTGMIIGDRYEIVGKVGTGGMADVYKAKDHKLNRFVAVKVLKPEFREDTVFIKKFKTEAQSAAGLTHPNIVNVFDVGDDNGIHYIVMELIEGITLKEYITKKGKLSVKEATSIAIQVSMGLEAAHSHGIVHRDVKPQNIIISTDGKVKVTDFGIARAASSNTISSNVMGSVHYSSPEQVRGGYSDEKSDIYSLGITLYEMVTGKVPFEGDTTVAIAIKHLQEEMVLPSTYSPDLPYSLEQIILKCTQKSVDRRYGNMEEVIADLKHSLIDPDGDFVSLVPLTSHAQTVVISGEELEQIKKGAAEAPVRPQPASTYERLDEPEEDETFDLDEEDEDRNGINRRLEKAMTIGGFIIGALIIAILIFLIGKATGIFNFSSKGDSGKKNPTQAAEDQDMVEVPDLVGLTEEDATKLVKELGIGIRYNGEENSDSVEKGKISSQEIESGTKVEKYSTIKYKLSVGTPDLTVPDVVGEMQVDAEDALKQMGFNVTIDREYSDEFSTGEVMSTSPTAGTSAKAGDTIAMIVSKGSEGDYVETPDVTGMTEEAAKKQLEQLTFTITVESETSDTVAVGTVISQDVEAGSWVAKSAPITITVSTGDGTQTTTPTPGETQAPPTDTSGTWKCTQTLAEPEDYNGGKLRMELVQTVNGSAKTQTLVDGDTVEFPYALDITGEPGMAEGTLYLSELVDGEYQDLGHYPLTFKKVD